MLSPRSRLESACRIGAFALLGWLIGSSIIRTAPRRLDRIPAGGEVRGALVAATRATDGQSVQLDAPVAPTSWITDWLAALKHTGTSVSWSGTPPAVLMSAEPIVDPRGGVRVDVAAPARARVRLLDDASAIDSTTVANLGATFRAPMAVGSLRAEVGGQTLTAASPDTASTRRVLVVGAAGWEGKFVVSALEERGWTVAARFTVAPGVDV